MKRVAWACIYVLGLPLAIAVSVPVFLFGVLFFDSWGGYHFRPEHIPCVWWHHFTGDRSR